MLVRLPIILAIAGLFLLGTPVSPLAQTTSGGRTSATASTGRARGKGRAAKRVTRHRADKAVDDETEEVTDSSHALEPRAWQVEIAWSLQSIRGTEAPTHEVTAPQALVRFGVSPRFELRASADGLLSDATRVAGTARVTGLSDIELGCKYVLRRESAPGGRGVGVGLIPGLSLPIGSAAFTSGGVDPSLTLVWDHGLPAGVDSSGSVTMSSVTDHGARFTQAMAGVSFGHNLPGGWSGFSDVAVFSALTRDGGSASFADVGLQHHFGRFSQVDVSIGRRLHGPAPSWVVTAGLAMRTPRRRPPPSRP